MLIFNLNIYVLMKTMYGMNEYSLSVRFDKTGLWR